MKKIVLLLALPLFSIAQNSFTVNIWDIRPDSICPGDSITVLYKIAPDNKAPSVPGATLYIASISTWTGTWSYLKSRKKEKWPSAPDSVWVITVKTPTNLPIGQQYVKFINQYKVGDSSTIAVKNCSCTIQSFFSYTVSGNIVTFSSTSVGQNSTTVYVWNFGAGAGTQTTTSTPSFTYAPGNNSYTVSLNVNNPTCSGTFSAVITTTATTTGIYEYQQGQIAPVYFDVMGNKVDPRPGLLLIEQRGTMRRKVLISN